MPLSDEWFTEVFDDDQTAVSVKLLERLHLDITAEPRIEIVQSHGLGRLLILDGRVTLAERDHQIYHEMLVHPALYAHPHPRRLVIVGGEDGGCLSEVVKHPEVEEIVRIGADERVERVCREFLSDLSAAAGDPRVRRVTVDPGEWLEQTEARSADVVILDMPRALSFAEGLYVGALAILDDQGLLVQPSGSPLIHTQGHIRPMHDALRRAGFLDVLTLHFPQSLYPTGWWTVTTACKDMPIMFCREEQAEQLPFETRYYNAAMHRTSTATPQFVHRSLMA